MKVHTSLVASIFFLVTLVAPTEALAQAILPVSRGGTGTGSFTVGSLLFYNGSTITEDNSNLFWDDTNNRLGIGTSSPTTTLDVSGGIKATSLTTTSDSIINSLTIGRGGGSVSTNTAIGQNALISNTTGIHNTAVGFHSLAANNSVDNTAIGFFSLVSNTGYENIAIGSRAMLGSLTGNRIVAIGHDTGGPQTTAYNSIYIGKSAEGSTSDENNAIVIGNEKTIGAGTNTAVIGNSSMTDIYFGSANSNSNIHGKKLYLGSSSIPGCIIVGDSDGSGVTYLTVNDGALTASTTAPSACE